MKKRYNVLKKITFGLLFITTCLFTLSIGTDLSVKDSNKLILSADTWKSDLVEVKDYISTNGIKYVDIEELVQLDENGLVLSVRNPEDIIDENTVILINSGLGVYYFSEICNEKLSSTSSEGENNDNSYYVDYLGFHYELGANIDYEEAAMTFKMLRPIGWKENMPFSGIFDGRGNTISNIFYRPFEDESEVTKLYSGMECLAWFSQNEGTIKNLGIVNPNIIQYGVYSTAEFVSPFVGVNSGTIENCFVQDLRGNESGISAEGGYIMSMFVSINSKSGTIKNSYVAANKIAATSVTMTSSENRSPFVSGNNNESEGAISNCYFDSQALLQYATYNTNQISGVTPLNSSDFSNPDKFNHYDDNDTLSTEDDVQVWYSNGTYPTEYAGYFRASYPVLLGFSVEKVNDEDYFLIESANQLVYMSELIDQYQIFRDSNYLLVNTVDLNTVKQDSFVFTQSVFSGVLMGGEKAEDGYDLELANGEITDKNSILNLKINKGSSYQGYHCYGLFGVLSGTVENINIVHAEVTQDDLTDSNLNFEEKNAVGTVCGLLEGGTIKDVNVYTNINLQQGDSTTFLGAQYVGGICGVAKSGEIIGSTTNGSINSPLYTPTSNSMDVELSHSIGGVLGKAFANDGVKNCLNNIEISAINYSENPGSLIRQYLGGVIGSGDINNTYQLQNNANIIVGEDDVTNTFYSLVYAGGIIGRVSDAINANGVYFNNGNLTYYVNNNNYKAYISGVMNVISSFADPYDAFETDESYNQIVSDLAQQDTFEFTSLSSGGTLNIENDLTESKYPSKYQVFANVTAGIDIRAAGLVYSYLTKMNVVGGYNLDKHYEWNDDELEEKINNPQSIDISMIDEYAPTFNADNKVAYVDGELHLDTNYLTSKSNTVNNNTSFIDTTIYLERVYNYSGVNYITNNIVNTYMLQLSGCINGRNFNLKNIRNDGDIKVYFSYATHTNMTMNSNVYLNYFGDYKKLKVYGVMEEVSLDHRAEDIYNGGNITVSSGTNIVPNFNLYVSGICYKNVGNDPAAEQELMIESGYQGSLHNCINNGEIRMTNGDIINADPTSKITSSGRFYGVSRAAGIACINSSTISQTFNLGDIYNINSVYAISNTYGGYTSADLEVETGGICFIMQNEVYDAEGNATSGNIIDSANNGVIVAMNTSNVRSFTNAGGFVGRNDRGEDGLLVNEGSVSVASHTSKIQYSINYGDIYAYNNYQTLLYAGEQQSKAAGFVCLGACTIVDVINYGNIYGNSVAAGMFGHLYITRMRDAGLSPNSPINIANSINYGNVKILNVSNSNVEVISDIGNNNGTASVRETIPNNTSQNTRLYVAGALIGAWAYGEDNNDISSIKVKYLVNFNDELDILGSAYDAEYTGNNVTTLKNEMLRNMATTKAEDTSPAPFDTDDNTYTYGIKSYTKDTSAGDKSLINIYSQAYNGGIFNEDYSLRSPGELTLDGNGEVDKTNTDNFIADYIQFVPYSKVNDYLVEKIGLKDTVYENAVNSILTSEEFRKIILEAYFGLDTSNTNSIYNFILAHNSFPTAEKGALTDKAIMIDLLEILISNHSTAELYETLIEVLQSVNSVEELYGSTDNLLSILEVVSADSANDIELYERLINTLINTDGFIESLYLNNTDKMNTLINNYASSLDESSLIVLFNAINNGTSISEVANNITENDQISLFTDIFSNVSDNVILSLYEDVSNEDRIISQIESSTLADLQIVLNDYIANNNNIISNANVNSYKDNYELENDTKLTLIQNNATSADIYEVLTDEQIDILWDSIISSNELSTAINRIKQGNYLYILANPGDYQQIMDAVGKNIYSENLYTVNNGGFDVWHNDSREIIYVGQYVYNGTQYVDSTDYYNGDRRAFTFDSYGLGNDNRYYPISAGSYSRINNEANYYYMFTRSGNNTGYIYFNNNVYQGHGTHERINSQNFVNHNSLTQLTIEGIKDLLDRVFNNTNAINDIATATMLEPIEDILTDDQINTLYNDITLNKEDLREVSENLELEEIKSVLIAFAENNANFVTDYINEYGTAANRDNMIFAIAIASLDNGAYYETVLDEIYDFLDVQDHRVIVVEYARYSANARSEVLSRALLSDSYTLEDRFNGVKDISSSDIRFTDDFISALYGSGYLSDTDIENMLTEIIDNNSVNMKLILSNINLTDSDKEELSIIYGSEDETIFKDIMNEQFDIDLDSTDYESVINEIINDTDLELATFTDFTGIYALASSHGILNGLFLPDNIELIDMDYYYTDGTNLVNDPTWRGGTSDNPNAYDVNIKTTVNYKVYYEMKQLKKSIATIIFNMELVDATIGDDGIQAEYENVLTNNPETDYIIGEEDEYGREINEVYFYVPVNHDILNKDKIYANMTSGSYELSYGASFDTETNKLEISVPDNLTVGDVLSDTFIVQAEDTNVKTTYTLHLVVTRASYLDPITGITVGTIGGTITDAEYSTTITSSADAEVVTSNSDVATAVVGFNGVIRVSYTTKNLANRSNLLSFVNVYSTESNILDEAINSKELLTLNENYRFNNVVNNGIVVIPNVDEDETGYNSATNAYNDGSVFFDLSIDNYMSAGWYLIEIALNDTTKYYIFFEKEKSDNASLISLSYNGQTYNGGGNDNQNYPSVHPYGTVLTKNDLTNIENGKTTYLDDLVIAPLAKIENVDAYVTETDGFKSYTIVYEIIAEDGETTNTFTHYITEQAYNTNIETIFLNGGIEVVGPIESPENGYIYTTSFAKDETPSYRFEYDLSGFYTTLSSEFFKVVYYDENGNKIEDSEIITLLDSYYSVSVIEGKSFEVSFYDTAESIAYYFGLVYENSIEFTTDESIEWNVEFAIINLNKQKNIYSYFDNVTFLSESVVSSIRTMITTEDITLEDYYEMLEDATREIVALPSKIYYNDYEMYEDAEGIIHKEAAFYMIGLVNKTQLDYYAPTFTVPDGATVYRTEIIGGVTYRYVPYYIDDNNDETIDQHNLTIFLVSEDGTSYRNEEGAEITDYTVGDGTLTYDGNVYMLSDVAGKQTIELDGVTIENTSLRTDYSEFGSFDEVNGVFKYVTYRVYAEIYDSTNNTNDYYTDYYIAAQDLTNNVKFNITIDYEEGCLIKDSIYNLYVEFTCYALPENVQSTNREDYTLYNSAGLFAYFDDDNVLKHHELQANIAGYYSIYIALADGYTYSYVVTDNNEVDENVEGEEFFIVSEIFARTIDIHITIKNAESSTDDWGVHVKDESFLIPSNEEKN